MGNAAQRRNQWDYEKSMQRNLPHCLPHLERRPDWIGPRREEYEAHVYDEYQSLHYHPDARDRMKRRVEPFQMINIIAWPADGNRHTLMEEAEVEMAYFRVDPPSIEVCRIPAQEYDHDARCPDRFRRPLPPELNQSLTVYMRACDVRCEVDTLDRDHEHLIVPETW
jgi:hypothetical protein